MLHSTSWDNQFFLFKVSYVTATFPYIILTALVIKGALLEGADKGVEFYVSLQILKFLLTN